MANDAVASALVFWWERAREAVGGSWMFVRRRGFPGLMSDFRRRARRWDVWGLKDAMSVSA